jgi:hypothetical protein
MHGGLRSTPSSAEPLDHRTETRIPTSRSCWKAQDVDEVYFGPLFRTSTHSIYIYIYIEWVEVHKRARTHTLRFNIRLSAFLATVRILGSAVPNSLVSECESPDVVSASSSRSHSLKLVLVDPRRLHYCITGGHKVTEPNFKHSNLDPILSNFPETDQQ